MTDLFKQIARTAYEDYVPKEQLDKMLGETTPTIENFLSFLNRNGVNVNAELVDLDNYGFSRTIAFTVYGIEYRIVWFQNESTLQIGAHKRAARIPFKYMYLDECFPLVGGNKSIGFAYTKLEKTSVFDREYPYEVFRIPIEI